uniref:Uncharacterized protein n=1 Tax=Ditylenchus dipsaci TaxID=166011 RepID=A0A915DWP5_9BILA
MVWLTISRLLGGQKKINTSITFNVTEIQMSREQQICRLGWVLLFMWLSMVVYMTREIWFTGEDRNADLFPRLQRQEE